MKRTRSNEELGLIYGLLASMMFGSYLLVNRYAYTHYSVDTLSYVVTFLGAGGLFAGLSLVANRLRHGRRVVQGTLPGLLGNGVVAGGGLALVIFGQRFTTAINVSIIATVTVVTTMMFSWLLVKQSFNQKQLWWLIVLFIGFYTAIAGFQLISFNKGDLLILLASVAMGFSNVLSQILIRENNKNVVADVRLFTGGLLFITAGLVFRGSGFAETGAGLWPVLSGFFFWLTIHFFYASIQHVAANKAIVAANSHPFFTALIAVLVLDEPYSAIKFMGSALVLLSVYHITKK